MLRPSAGYLDIKAGLLLVSQTTNAFSFGSTRVGCQMIIFNIIGLVMLAIGFGMSFGVGSVGGLTGEGPLMIVAGPLLIVSGIWHRMSLGASAWFRPRAGGSLFFAPVWLWGVIWSVLGVVYTLQGR